MELKKFISTVIMILVGIISAFAQISLTATAGITGPASYSTLTEAFDAVNLGMHKGVLTL